MRRIIAIPLALALLAAACSADGSSADSTVSAAGGTTSVAAAPRLAGTEAGVASAFSQVGTLTPMDGGGITVSGLGKVTGAPDTLTLNIGVSVMRDSVTEAVDDAAQLADALLTKLRTFGVADEDLQTSNFSIYPEYDYRNETRRIIGYRVTNQLTVKIRDLDKAGEIVDAAASQAGDELVVNGVSFSIEDNEAMIKAAREAAWADALSKASQLAGLAGVTLGAPSSIIETFAPSPSPLVYTERLAAAQYDVATPIEAGSELVTVSLTVVFTIG